MGLGDVKLAASVGTALAGAAGPALVVGTFLTFALAAIYGVALLLLRRRATGQASCRSARS